MRVPMNPGGRLRFRCQPKLRGAHRALCVLAGMLLLGACQGPDGHIRPDGMVIRQGEQVLVHARGGSLEGELQVAAGAELPISIRFLNRSGVEIVPQPLYFVEIWAADPELFEWRTEEPGAFDGRLAGLEPGRTTLLIRWMHGPGAGHKDRDWPVTLTVVP